jgi:ribosomal silencing factor RsfS
MTEIERLRRENERLVDLLKQVTEIIHAASRTLYNLEFGMGALGVGDLDTAHAE